MISKRTKQQWLDLLGQQEQSGLSMAEFCRTQNINPKHFYYHSKKRRRSVADDHASTVFVRATMANNKATSGNLNTQTIRLQHKQSELSLPATIPPDWLAALMVALV
ncbi:MAG: hypothetical protein KAG18_08945 [Sinobacterium sp.]|nr:hypothetical protein [Sinobacterium sp.]